MSAAKEEALDASGDDLAVDDLPEGMFHHLADPANLLAAKKLCMVPDASPAPNPSPATSSGSDPALPAHSPMPLTVAALSAPSFGLAPSLVATAASPNSPTIGDPYRVARLVYGRLLFSWPSQDDAAAFRKLFPLTLKVSNSHPFLLKVFEDTLEAFTAAKAAGAPTLSIRNIPLDFDPEGIRTYLLSSTESDGSR
ncbi:unnamed protein product [Closterium sp. NIES-54]